jgi:uncharacterized protein YkwD
MLAASRSPAWLGPAHNPRPQAAGLSRATHGLPQIPPSKELRKAARPYVDEAVQLKWWAMGANPHVNPQTGSTVLSRIKAAGYCGGKPIRVSEIAYTGTGPYSTFYAAINWWMNISTQGHRQAILDPAIKEIGTGTRGDVADPTLAPKGNGYLHR